MPKNTITGLRQERKKFIECITANQNFLNDCYYQRSKQKLRKCLVNANAKQQGAIKKIIESCIALNCGIKISKSRAKRIKRTSNYSELLQLYHGNVSGNQYIQFLAENQQFVKLFLGNFNQSKELDTEKEGSSNTDTDDSDSDIVKDTDSDNDYGQEVEGNCESEGVTSRKEGGGAAEELAGEESEQEEVVEDDDDERGVSDGAEISLVNKVQDKGCSRSSEAHYRRHERE